MTACRRSLVGDDVDRDVARLGVALEVVEHGRAVGVGSWTSKHDRVGLVLVGKRQAVLAAHAPPAP